MILFLLRPSLNCRIFVLRRLNLIKYVYYKLLNLKILQKIALFLLLAFPAISGFANRRHFTYTYESAVLPKASHELEIWNTIRLNRKVFFRGLDTRAEFEFGLGGNFQTSLYLNMSSAT